MDDHFLRGAIRSRSRWSLHGRRRNPMPVAIVAVALGLVVLWRVVGSEAPADEQDVAAAVPTDRLLPLVAPEVRGFAAVLDEEEGSGLAREDLAPARPVVPTWVEGEIGPGETLTGALVELGVPADALHRPVHVLGQIVDFRRTQAGDAFEAELTSDGTLLALRYQRSAERFFEARRVEDGSYEAREEDVPLDISVASMSGTIQGSLNASIVAAGERGALASELADMFQWDIDFSRDVRPGDAFRMLYERVELDGEFLRYGNILAAEYQGQRASAVAYYFDDPQHHGYYTPEGEPLRKMFLAAPCSHRRISSYFDPQRFHPVLQRVVPHNGVDYAADTGTPVRSVADGTVTFVGFRSRAGNLIRVRHAGGYETAYAHLSRFARGLSSGDRVEQGQVIGFVGNTGMSTGPHLHFGLKLRGTWVDPLEHQGSRGPGLSGRALRDFQRQQSALSAELAELALAEVDASAAEEEEAPAPDGLPFVDMHGAAGVYDDDL